MPRVSVVIPVCDSAASAETAVASVLAQTFVDLEIVLVDDGSEPAEAAALARIAEHDRVRFIRQGNQGPAKARRHGWEAAKGELVSFLDSDDRYHPEYVARCVDFLDAHPKHGAVYTKYVWVIPGTLERGRVQPEFGPDGWIFEEEIKKSRVKNSTLMVRRDHLLGLEGLSEYLYRGQTYDMILRLAYRVTFGFLDEVLVEVFKRQGSLSRPGPRRESFLNRVEILESLEGAFPDMKAETRAVLRRKVAKYCAKTATRFDRKGEHSQALELYQKAVRVAPSVRTRSTYWLSRLESLFPGRRTRGISTVARPMAGHGVDQRSREAVSARPTSRR